MHPSSIPPRRGAITSVVGALLFIAGDFILPSFYVTDFYRSVIVEPSFLQVIALLFFLPALTSLILGIWAFSRKPPRWLPILTCILCLLGIVVQILIMLFLAAFDDTGVPLLSLWILPLLGLAGYLLSIIGAIIIASRR